jgi:hypothetical protein
VIARLYQAEDAKGVDVLLKENRHGDVQLKRDQLIVLGAVGDVKGVLAGRPVYFVHELAVNDSLLRRAVVEALVNYGIGFARGTEIRDAVFLIDPRNHALRRVLLDGGAVKQPISEVYCMELR